MTNLFNSLRDIRQLTRRNIVVSFSFVLIMLLVFGAVAYLAPHQRAITIEADTLSVTIEFTSVQNDWLVNDEVVFCERMQGTPRELRLLMDTQKRRDNHSVSVCGDGPYTQSRLDDTVMRWSKGTRVKMVWNSGSYPLQVQFVSVPADDAQGIPASNDVPAGSFYLLSESAIRQSGVARYTGHVIIGEVPTSGSYDHLLSGRYEIWDIPGFGRPATRTLSGLLLLGDTASVVRNSRCSTNCNVEGEVIIAFNVPKNSMHVILHSGKEDDRLRIDRFGGNRAFLASNWFDRARNDSVLIALSSILALVAALSAAGSGILVACRFCKRQLTAQN